MIIETIFSTVDVEGMPNFAPMGVIWGEEFCTVRPYRTTRTCGNLFTTGVGVVNITDNVLAYVQTALYDGALPFQPARAVDGVVFVQACSWRELEVVESGGSETRAEFRCRVVHNERRKDFLGFCRAGNAVLEATILATRLDLYERGCVNGKMDDFDKIVGKTGGVIEKEAMQLVRNFVLNAESK
ncbi:MAG: DUF447 family protein [Acidobacteriota bacterium]